MSEHTKGDDDPTIGPVTRDSVVEVVAKIGLLPSNGLFLSGKIRDLSPGGCCADTPVSIECGARAEIVVHVNSSSFRAVGEVRGIHGHSEAGIQFIYRSGGGKDLLADLIAELARLQALIHQLKAARRDAEMESFRTQLEDGKHLAAMWSERLRSLEGFVPAESSETDQVSSAGGNPSKEAHPLVTPVSLFS